MTEDRGTKIVVLVTSAFGGIGGIESFNRALVSALDELSTRHSWTVQVLSLLDREDSPEGSAYVHSSSTQLKGFSGDRVRFAFSACLAGCSADFVIVGHINLAPLVLAMNSSFKCLITHGIEVWRKLPWLKSLSVKRMNRILSVSAYTQQQMMSHNALPKDRFYVFPNTLDPTTTFRPPKLDRIALGLPQGHMLLSVSRLASSEPYKNIRAVIECLPALLAQEPGAFYVIVGDGSERKILEELTIGLGLANKVFFPGAVPEERLSSYYEQCDVFVLPSLNEGFGIVFLEAMNHGKPCIGARAGGVPEVIRENITGVLVDPSELSAQLPLAIMRLLRDSGLRLSMGANGRADLETKFSYSSFRERLDQILSAYLTSYGHSYARQA